MKRGLVIIFLFLLNTGFAQYKVTFVLDRFPDPHKEDAIFIAGNFNSWNPGATSFTAADKRRIIEMQLEGGIYEYKCTRGGWDKVEAQANGGDVINRLLKLKSDTIINIEIAAWKDDFASAPKVHTASANVQVMDTAFSMPGLNRSRRIWIYLPANYETSKQRYSVLYMHDGQNLFDNFTSGFGEWGVDEALDTLIAKGKPACIVVGIDNGQKRMNEYNPFDNPEFGSGEGAAYVEFLATNLKPYIDKHYRTTPDKEHTIIAGSSMGGLISFYAMLKYPEVFGKGGIFSPAFWTAPGLVPYVEQYAKKTNGKMFFYMGGLEGERYMNDMKEIEDRMGELSGCLIYSVTDDESRHNETAWRKWFPEFYQWIIGDGFNNPVKVGN